MRVFLHRDRDGEYLSVNFAVAAHGFREMGWEAVGYRQVEDRLPELRRADVVVDFLDECRTALTHLGVVPPTVPTYPEVLRRFLGRRIWTSMIDAVAALPESRPVFVNPRDDAGGFTKKFTGVLVRRPGDLVGCGDPSCDTPVGCSEPVRLVREWRCFVRYGRILDVRPYRGDWRGRYDPAVMEECVAAWTDKPHGCALDFAVDQAGRTLLVEVNDGLALGAYGLDLVLYARLLSARWAQITRMRDWCDF